MTSYQVLHTSGEIVEHDVDPSLGRIYRSRWDAERAASYVRLALAGGDHEGSYQVHATTGEVVPIPSLDLSAGSRLYDTREEAERAAAIYAQHQAQRAQQEADYQARRAQLRAERERDCLDDLARDLQQQETPTL